MPLKGAGGGPLRTPLKISDSILLENVDDQNYGYMRIVVNKEKLVIEYHAAVNGQQTKSPSDAVTVDLKTHEMISN